MAKTRRHPRSTGVLVTYSLRTIATVRSSRVDAIDDDWDRETMTIELEPEVPETSLTGLSGFSHVEVIFLADHAIDVPPAPWTRHPRGREEWPVVGVFANRNKDRPNRLLASVVELLAVNGGTLSVRGLDAIDGTPVLDIKPWYRWSGPRGDVRAPTWSDELGETYY